MKALFDTSVLIDCHIGVPAAAEEIERYDELAVSRVVWIEFLVGARTPNMKQERELLLKEFELIELEPAISAEAVIIRQSTRLKLPDAIILATARVHGLLFVTRNYRDFPRREPHVRIPY